MFHNKIKTIGDVKSCDVIELAQLIGKAVAIDVKKQVGIDVSKIKIRQKHTTQKTKNSPVLFSAFWLSVCLGWPMQLL